MIAWLRMRESKEGLTLHAMNSTSSRLHRLSSTSRCMKHLTTHLHFKRPVKLVAQGHRDSNSVKH